MTRIGTAPKIGKHMNPSRHGESGACPSRHLVPPTFADDGNAKMGRRVSGVIVGHLRVPARTVRASPDDVQRLPTSFGAVKTSGIGRSGAHSSFRLPIRAKNMTSGPARTEDGVIARVAILTDGGGPCAVRVRHASDPGIAPGVAP